MIPRRILLLVACVALLCGCVTRSSQVRSSALDFLYPEGAPAAAATDVTLRVPVRVGIAFAPARHGASEFTPDRQQQLLERVAAAFRGRESIGDVEVIPATYLKPEGGFEDLDRVASAFGVDLAVLVSYDQVQFSDSTNAALAYWTLVGAYVVKGEKNETRTMLNAAVFDIPSRAMLFHASGQSSLSGSSTPVGTQKALRAGSDRGFEEATDDLIAKLDLALASFQEQAKSGTVRGPGTPALALADREGRPLEAGGSGGGAAGAVEIALALLLLAAGARRS